MSLRARVRELERRFRELRSGHVLQIFVDALAGDAAARRELESLGRAGEIGHMHEIIPALENAVETEIDQTQEGRMTIDTSITVLSGGVDA